MGRFLGNCKGDVDEIAVLGVRTRARASALMAETTTSLPANKIRKLPLTTTTSYDQVRELKRRRRDTVTPENSVSCRLDTTKEEDVVVVEMAANCSSNDEICSDFPASCCSNREELSSYEVVKNRLEIVIADPKITIAETSPRCFDFVSHRTTRREENAGVTKSDDQGSPPRLPDAKSSVQIKMSSDNSEIEEFFTAAEKDLQKRFSDKYNFDIVKDVPLEGRYEWVQIKP